MVLMDEVEFLQSEVDKIQAVLVRGSIACN